jgi:two-component sensor histidine kinase
MFWTVSGGGDGRVLQFQWREREGPEVVAPRHQFGTSLIKTTVPESFFDYAPQGMTCKIELRL